MKQHSKRIGKSMSNIVKYHNDFNKIKLPSFTEQEQNLLCFLFTKIKEKKENESEEIESNTKDEVKSEN